MVTESPEMVRAPEPPSTTAVWLAKELAKSHFPRGDLAQLRRMNPDYPNVPAFWRLMAQRNLLGSPHREQHWAIVLQGIAIMTPTGTEGRSAHDKDIPVGRALFFGGDPKRTTGFYSEARLKRLVTARGTILHTLLGRMFRMLSGKYQPLDWGEMAPFILFHDSLDTERLDRSRLRIARAYYRAASQSEQSRS